MSINTNISSMTAQPQLGQGPGLAVHGHGAPVFRPAHQQRQGRRRGPRDLERFTTQIRGLNQAVATPTTASRWRRPPKARWQHRHNLQRMRELAVQSANASNSGSDRKAIQAEVGQLLSELDRIATTTEFNGQKLLDGSFGSATFQVGANANQTITATTGNFRTNSYGTQLVASGPIDPDTAAPDLSGSVIITASTTRPSTDTQRHRRHGRAAINAAADTDGRERRGAQHLGAEAHQHRLVLAGRQG
jgi:flagellin